MIEFIIIGVILLFVVLYRSSNGESVYKFVKKQTTTAYEKYAPYSYKEMSAKIKELGLQFTKKQYLIQIIFFMHILAPSLLLIIISQFFLLCTIYVIFIEFSIILLYNSWYVTSNKVFYIERNITLW